MPGARIVVVEDEETIREGICHALRREGHMAEAFDEGLGAWEALQRGLPDLVVLDIGLPRMDGLELCKRIRAKSETLPIIFVTSREDEFDRVLGLEIGADDYLCKPFSMRELMARVKVLLRRARYAEGPMSDDERTVAAGDLLLDPLRLAVTWKGKSVPLTVTEFLLLHSLALRPGVVKTRHLMRDAYPDMVSVSDRTIDSHVKRIRRKFAAIDPGSTRLKGSTAPATATTRHLHEVAVGTQVASLSNWSALACVQSPGHVRTRCRCAVPGHLREGASGGTRT
jgi:two-component system response regulator ChvI